MIFRCFSLISSIAPALSTVHPSSKVMTTSFLSYKAQPGQESAAGRRHAKLAPFSSPEKAARTKALVVKLKMTRGSRLFQLTIRTGQSFLALRTVDHFRCTVVRQLDLPEESTWTLRRTLFGQFWGTAGIVICKLEQKKYIKWPNRKFWDFYSLRLA